MNAARWKTKNRGKLGVSLPLSHALYLIIEQNHRFKMKQVPVIDQVLDLAQALVQLRGFNAMSYRDLADGVGVKTSSIHYYFPAKEDLGLALLKRYRAGFKGALMSIEYEVSDPKLKIERFVELFVDTVSAGKICLGGMFASDCTTLPLAMQEEVKHFYAESEAWLADVLKQGRALGQLSFIGSPIIKAETIFSTLEGVMIAARLFKDEKRLMSAGEWILSSLSK